MTIPAIGEALDGKRMRELFRAAAEHLRARASAIDAINVYPVPDGDTGSNMAATLAEAVSFAEHERSERAGDVLRAVARGALYGARGNSGVILSQALRGFAEGVVGYETLDARAVAEAFTRAAASAYAAVAEPVEGTMLTVLRAAADAARQACAGLPSGGAGAGCEPVFAAALASAEAAEASTPDLLPVLREAGVPDAGGEGVCTMLRAFYAELTGRPIEREPELPRLELRPGDHGGEFGFCTEFLLQRAEAPLAAPAIRDTLRKAGGRSVVVVGDADAVHVHVHADDPGVMVAACEAFGTVSRLKAEDMTAQHRRFAEAGSGATAAVALLAFSPSRTFDDIFRSLGAEPIRLDPLTKPAVREIVEAAERLQRPDVIVLPNHKNVVMAAQQAAELSRRATLHVVPAKSVPQGIAAAVAFDPELPVRESLGRMQSAAEAVRTVEVTTATQSRTLGGIEVRPNDAIALVDDELVAATRDPIDALLAGLEAAGAPQAELVTVYAGDGVNEETLAQVKERIRERFPEAENEVHRTGQPLYPFIASVE